MKSRKIFELMMTFIGITLIAFFMIRFAPGDPVLLMVGERGADQAQYLEMAKRLHLDGSLVSQYWSFLGAIVRGNLGVSIVSQYDVLKELLTRWPATIELGVSALMLSIIIGIPAGMIAAVKRNTVIDYLIMTTSLVGYSMPIFWWGLVLIIFFSIGLDLTPVSGRIGLLYDIQPVTGFMLVDTVLPQARLDYGLSAFGSALAHLILPAFTMATIPIAVFARMTRSSMLEALSEDYIRTARAKGLTSTRIVCVHAFRNALVPVVTVGGILFVSTVITGAILTETIFGWPGIGSYVVSSVYARDYPVIQGSILLIGVFVVVVNLLIDIAYVWVNPRLRV